MSTPLRTEKAEVPVREVGSPKILDLGTAATFDDGISAISAHTLEELARQNPRSPHKFGAVRSDLTHEEQGACGAIGNSKSNESSIFHLPRDDEERDCVGEFPLSRERSNTTWGSKGGKSLQTKSTQSSTDFEHMWRLDEQQYWQEEVEEDENGRLPVRKGSVRHLQMMINQRADMRERNRSRDSVSLTLLVLIYSRCSHCSVLT